MILSDIIALAKAGYTPANVKELMTLDTQQTAPADTAPADTAPADTAPADNTELDKLRAELAEVKVQLAEAQSANRRVDVSQNTNTLEAQIDEFVRAFM